MSNTRQRRKSGSTLHGSLQQYLASHRLSLTTSLQRILAHPIGNTLTVLVIAIALALPGVLLVLTTELERVTQDWRSGTNLTLFLESAITPVAAEKLATRLRTDHADITAIEIHTPDEALEEFRRLSGFRQKLDHFDKNPLPVVMVLTLATGQSATDNAVTLAETLQQDPAIDLAQLDLDWLRQLAAMTEIGRHAILAFGGLLLLGALLVIGNTIRLEIENRRDEIEITKLVGGTTAFVRRPFLYSGLWFGLLGSVSAWLMVAATIWFLDAPVRRFAGLYDSGFQLSGISPSTGLALVGAGIALGVGGAWLATLQHLRRIEPR